MYLNIHRKKGYGKRGGFIALIIPFSRDSFNNEWLVLKDFTLSFTMKGAC
jgi:hypothetical protein